MVARASRIVAVIVVGYWLTIFLLTHLPHPPTPRDRIPHLDKLAHATVYAGLAFLLSFAWRRLEEGSRTFYLRLLAVIAAYGIADELLQKLVPPRTADFWDWVADMVGASLGVMVHVWMCRYVARRGKVSPGKGKRRKKTQRSRKSR